MHRAETQPTARRNRNAQASAEGKPIWRPAGRASTTKPSVGSSAAKVGQHSASRSDREMPTAASKKPAHADSTMPQAESSATSRIIEAKTQGRRRTYVSKVEFFKRRAKLPVMRVVGPHPHVLKLPSGPECKQDDWFADGVCNTNILVYFGIPEGDITTPAGKIIRYDIAMKGGRRRMCAALADAFYKADPTLLLENRFYFEACRWPGGPSTQNELLMYLEDLIANHRILCDWLEEHRHLRVLKKEKSERVDRHPGDERLSSTTGLIMPMMRSVILLVWPAQVDELGYAETTCSLVLTGDDARLKSGPLSFDTLPDRVRTSDDRVVNLSLNEAVVFLTMVDKREVAANAALRARKEACAERIRRSWTAEDAEKPIPRSLTATIYGNGFTLGLNLRDDYGDA